MWAVVTLPAREAMADELIRSLGMPARKVLDTAGDIQRNHIRAWTEACAFGGDWVGVMQDDAVLCAGFAAKVHRRLAEADALGYRAVSFYNGSHLDAYLERTGERWGRIDLARMPGIRRDPAGDRLLKSSLPGELCVAVRREVAERYAAFAARHAELYRLYPGVHDGIFGLFLNAELGGVADPAAITVNHVYIALPNLVDHRDVPSTLSHPSHGRRRASATFHPDAA
jgi:hypothetical protein